MLYKLIEAILLEQITLLVNTQGVATGRSQVINQLLASIACHGEFTTQDSKFSGYDDLTFPPFGHHLR